MAATVLVVEDETLIADDIQRTLVRLGYDVPRIASTGRQAVQGAGEIRPSLVLMDIKLRGSMDGIEAATQIRQQLDVPIVYLTSHSDEATLARARETHPYGYLIKPFDERELRSTIEIALHKHEMEAHLARRERWFSTTLQCIGDAVIATDQDETITFINVVAERLTGWKWSEAVGRRVDEVLRLVDADGAPMQNPIRVALQSSFAVALPANSGLIGRNGRVVAVDDSAAPIIDDGGAVLGGGDRLS